MIKRHRTRGQSTVEFALVATIFFTMIFGIIEGGRLLFTYHQINNAAREGARYAVAHGIANEAHIDESDYQAMIDHIADRTTGLSVDGLSVSAEWPGDTRTDRCPQGSNEAGCPVRVTTTYSYEPMLAMFSNWGGISMSSSSEMRIHY
jgi:Flp pilus assembly protein TadG